MAGLYRGKNNYHVVFERVADFSAMSVGSRDIAVRTTPLSMSIALKNSSNVPSHTEPPRGTIASPNTVITMEPVREGSRLSWSMMRANGCAMPNA